MPGVGTVARRDRSSLLPLVDVRDDAPVLAAEADAIPATASVGSGTESPRTATRRRATSEVTSSGARRWRGTRRVVERVSRHRHARQPGPAARILYQPRDSQCVRIARVTQRQQLERRAAGGGREHPWRRRHLLPRLDCEREEDARRAQERQGSHDGDASMPGRRPLRRREEWGARDRRRDLWGELASRNGRSVGSGRSSRRRGSTLVTGFALGRARIAASGRAASSASAATRAFDRRRSSLSIRQTTTLKASAIPSETRVAATKVVSIVQVPGLPSSVVRLPPSVLDPRSWTLVTAA